MKLIVYTVSDSFKKYFSGAIGLPVEFRSILVEPELESGIIYFLHISSLGNECINWLKKYSEKSQIKVAVCSNIPDINEMLNSVRSGSKAYCNSYMQAQLYTQLLRLVENGQGWFPPEMWQKTFELAHKAIHGNDLDKLLEDLTDREKEIAKAVSEGFPNKSIARDLNISEPTVKTHLTNIFKKLQLNDRVALILYLKQS